MRKLALILTLITLIFILFYSLSDKARMLAVQKGNFEAKPIELIPNHFSDAYCKMTITQKEFAVQLISDAGKTWLFDDIGCMAKWLDDKMFETAPHIFVYTQDSHTWIKAQDAHYNSAEKSPMGYNFAAYEIPDASYQDFNTVINTILKD